MLLGEPQTLCHTDPRPAAVDLFDRHLARSSIGIYRFRHRPEVAQELTLETSEHKAVRLRSDFEGPIHQLQRPLITVVGRLRLHCVKVCPRRCGIVGAIEVLRV